MKIFLTLQVFLYVLSFQVNALAFNKSDVPSAFEMCRERIIAKYPPKDTQEKYGKHISSKIFLLNKQLILGPGGHPYGNNIAVIMTLQFLDSYYDFDGRLEYTETPLYDAYCLIKDNLDFVGIEIQQTHQ